MKYKVYRVIGKIEVLVAETDDAYLAAQLKKSIKWRYGEAIIKKKGDDVTNDC